MLTENIQGTVNNVQNLVANLKTFDWLIVNFAGTALSRINTAIIEVNKMTMNDLKQLHEVSNGCKQAYDSQFATAVDSVLNDLKALDWELRSIQNDDGAHNTNAVDLLRLSLKDMKIIQDIPATRYSQWAPDRFWRSDKSEICQNVYTELEYKISITLYEKAMNKSNKNVYSLVQAIGNETIDLFVRCTSEYRIAVESTEQAISSHFDASNEAMQNDFNFSYAKILDISSNDLDNVQQVIVDLEEMLIKYSKNDTTKLKMSSLTTEKGRAYVEDILDRILSRINTRALVPLQTMTENSEVNIKKWLHGSLSALGMLVPYFDNGDIEKTSRNLNIWRYPVLKMNSNKMLKYNYEEYEKWITWPRMINILEMLRREDDKALFTEILTSYGNDISVEMYNLQSQFSSAKKDILNAYDELRADVQSFERQSDIDKDFIA